MIPLGILASVADVGTDYELIESTILTGNASSVTFANLSTYASTYRHLQIRAVMRASANQGEVGYRIRFNGGSSTDYSFHRLLGNGSSASSYGDAAATYFFITGSAGTGAAATTGAFGAIVTDILDAYSTTKNKTTRTLAGNATSVSLDSAGWFSTSALTSIVMESDPVSNFVSGSRFSLYGIKG